jgi:hypothetical protein
MKALVKTHRAELPFHLLGVMAAAIILAYPFIWLR